MEIPLLKQKIIENDYVPIILDELGCHHISRKTEWFSCGNPDGDNPSAITVYLNDSLVTVDYTRNITTKSVADIFDLVQFFQSCTFYKAVCLVCSWCGIDYYEDEYDSLPESLKFTRLIEEMSSDNTDYDEIKPVKPISEKILQYYFPVANDLFFKDNISYETQMLFEVGYDDNSNRITIPVRDEFGTLVGVKGRLLLQTSKMSEDEKRIKYLYLEHCNRAKILYGLYLSEKYIKSQNKVYVVEAEKGVMQLWDMGIKNCVATCGKKITQYQIDMLTRLCSCIVFCFDKDVKREELSSIADKFLDWIEIKAIIDKEGVLSEKESPTDNPQKFRKLLDSSCEVIRQGR